MRAGGGAAFGVDSGMPDLAGALMRMVGSRNVAVRAGRALDLGVVRAVATGGVADLEAFARWMTRRAV